MATDETYNGWSNRETWAFMLYVQNDEGLADTALDALAGGWLGPDARQDDALREFGEAMFTRQGYAAYMGDGWPAALQDAAADIGSLWRVNWQECVDALSDDS